MLQLMSVISVSSYRWEVVAAASILLPFVLTYIYTSWKALSITRNKALDGNEPPTLPYFIPFLGHALSWAADGNRIQLAGVKRFGWGTPFRLQLAMQNLYIVSGSDMVSALFKTARVATGNVATTIALEHAFGSPKEVISFYEADTSGSHPVPLPGSITKPEDRIFYITHKMINTYLSGQSLIGMTTRFQDNLAEAISRDSKIKDEWVDIPNLYAFLQTQILEAAVRSIFGDYILSLNPTFMEDFWLWNKGVGELFMKTPRWIKPQLYHARDKMMENIKRWHKYALEHYDISKAEEDDVEWEPYFGSKFERVRQTTFMKFKALDATARAAEDMGVIWAANANAIPAAAWLLIETLRNPELEARVRSEIENIQTTSIPETSSSSTVPTFDIPTLCSSTLLQSMYAETLRLTVRVVATRWSVVPTMNLNGWLFRKGDIVGCSSSVEAMNKTVWSTGENNQHPLDEFWAERFIVYPGIEESGPLRKQKKAKPATKPQNNADASHDGTVKSKPYFSLEGLSSTWIPYGGGVRLCPGRHFAKQEMITSMAVWLSAYDIELLSPRDGKAIKEGGKMEDFRYEVDGAYTGFGTCPPKGKVRCRVRRRGGRVKDE